MADEGFRLRDLVVWSDRFPLRFSYTVGDGPEAFFKALRDEGKLLASKCSRCGAAYVPVRRFCPACFGPMAETVPVGLRGVVYSFTVVQRSRDGERLPEPVVVALVRFPGFGGGLVHRLVGVEPRRVKIGLRVEAVLKPPSQRAGSLADIVGFKPAGPAD